MSHWLVNYAYVLLDDIPLAFAIPSSLWGGIWIATLVFYSRDSRFLAVNLVSIVLLMFLGHKEFYAAILVALTFYFLLLLHVSKKREGLWLCVLLWGIAVLCHKLALFYFPAMLPLFLRLKGGKVRVEWPRDDFVKASFALIGVILVAQLPTWISIIDPDMIHPRQYDNRILEMLTLPWPFADWVAAKSNSGAFQIFYFGEPAHFMYYFGFLILSAPLAIVIVARYRKDFYHSIPATLLMAIGCSLVWTFFWHPHMGWKDWDLFGTAAIPINLAAGLYWQNRGTTKNYSPDDIVVSSSM